ncbi:heparinase II/III family protein [Pelomonas sp. CA6]|uniref:heparinase II/III family protein n=1 Tax=Pelomonas sp. CA6 TaxID=2907999 RepID=UPI001F4BE16D|nr:alginate lyase family protein [Pelomonas sp. CA6]MCH7343707.1 heparinase II/III family protein [Pelomonas sp. CA6]
MSERIQTRRVASRPTAESGDAGRGLSRARAPAMARWRWAWARLRRMGPAEWGFRAWRLLVGRLRPDPAPQAPDRAPAATRWVVEPPASALSAPAVLAAAQAIAEGQVLLFGVLPVQLAQPMQWLRCPRTGRRADGPDADGVDLKWLWELNRHTHWVRLAQAWRVSGDAAWLERLREQILSWLDQGLPLRRRGAAGVLHSPFECALRLIQWAQVWQLVDGERGPLFGAGPEGAENPLRARWLQAVRRQALGTARATSRHSSANNHLLAELAGIFIAAQTWPCWPELRRAGERARAELERELPRQVGADGFGREQALAYAAYVADLMLAVERCAQAQQAPMSAAFVQRLRAMGEALAAFADRSGWLPQLGDGDGTQILALDPGEAARPQPAFGGALARSGWRFGCADARWPGDGGGAWLIAEGLPTHPSQPPAPRLSFPDGGHELFAARRGQPDEILGGMDVGPLGYLSIAAHGHADALALWLSVGGEPLLIDPGCDSYGDGASWRRAFRGTAAHNTVQVDGRDQVPSGGPFLWLRELPVQRLACTRDAAGGLTLRARHHGYAAQPGGFVHERCLSFDPAARRLVVQDLLQGRDARELALHWQVSPRWRVTERPRPSGALDGAQWRLQRDGLRVELRITAEQAQDADAPRIDRVSGRDAQGDEPPLGWCSPHYGRREPCTVLRWRQRARALQLRTELQVFVDPDDRNLKP